MIKYKNNLLFFFFFSLLFCQNWSFLSASEEEGEREACSFFASPFHDLCGVPLLGHEIGRIYEIVSGALYDQKTQEKEDGEGKD